MSDLIDRQAAIDAVHKNYDTILDFTSDGKTISYSIEYILSELPSGTDICVGGNLKYDEWCTDCKEYDQERHSCPRWNRVIRQTVEDVKAAQPGCEDAVYRKAVQMLLAYFVPEELYAEAVDGLRRLPSAQPGEDIRAMCGECDAWNQYKNYPQPGWIPVTERLPEEPYGCLVTVWDTNPVTMDEFENVLPYFVGWDGEQWNNEDGEQCPFEVIAWVPLPTPYREGEHG